MTMQKITAPRRGARVVVFEPRQSPAQEEVILDTFEMRPDEVREVDYPSATYAYRFEELFSRDEADAFENDKFAEAPPAQEPRDIPVNQDEIDAGRTASEAHQKAAKQAQKAADGRKSHDAPREQTTRSGAPKKLAERQKGTSVQDHKADEALQVSKAANPMTNPDPEKRSASGKSGEELEAARPKREPEKNSPHNTGKK